MRNSSQNAINRLLENNNVQNNSNFGSNLIKPISSNGGNNRQVGAADNNNSGAG